MAFSLNNNQYYAGLTNLALYIAMYDTVSSGKVSQIINTFKTESLDYGDQKIFRGLPLPTVSNYSKNSSLLTTNQATVTVDGVSKNVIEDTVSVNFMKLIKSTYTRQMLEMAVKSEYGVGEFIATVMRNIVAAKDDFIFDEIIHLLYTATYAKTEEITILDLTQETTPSELRAGKTLNQETISLGIQKVIDDLQMFNTKYNKYGLKQAVRLSDLRLIIFQPYKNEQVMHLMAELLKSDVIGENFPKPELVTIPEAKASTIPGYNAQVVGIVCHKAFVQLFDKLYFMGDFFDKSNLNVNNFLHFWYGLGIVPQLPNCMIKIKLPEATPETQAETTN